MPLHPHPSGPTIAQLSRTVYTVGTPKPFGPLQQSYPVLLHGVPVHTCQGFRAQENATQWCRDLNYVHNSATHDAKSYTSIIQKEGHDRAIETLLGDSFPFRVHGLMIVYQSDTGFLEGTEFNVLNTQTVAKEIELYNQAFNVGFRAYRPLTSMAPALEVSSSPLCATTITTANPQEYGLSHAEFLAYGPELAAGMPLWMEGESFPQFDPWLEQPDEIDEQDVLYFLKEGGRVQRATQNVLFDLIEMKHPVYGFAVQQRIREILSKKAPEIEL